MSAVFDAADYLREQRRRNARLYGPQTVTATMHAKRLMREAQAERDREREQERQAKQAALDARRDAAIAFLSGNGQKSAKEIITAIASKHGLRVSDLVSARRKADIVHARHEAMWLISKYTCLSYPRIGDLFGRDHTTVLHAVDAYAIRHGEQVYHTEQSADDGFVQVVRPPRVAVVRIAKPKHRHIVPSVQHRQFNAVLDEEIARCKALDASRATFKR